jgi:hypothetical protein
LTIFYSILNTAGVNSEIIYRNNTNDFTTTRREFLKCLGKELITEHQESRQQNIRLPKDMCGQKRTNMQADPDEAPTKKKKDLCEICPRNLDGKSQYFCVTCKKTIFLGHSIFMCNKCANKYESE